MAKTVGLAQRMAHGRNNFARGLLRMFALMGLLGLSAASSGCGGSAPVKMGEKDMSMVLACDGPECSGHCGSDDDCTNGTHCDPTSMLCVGCYQDDNCAPGSLCNMSSNECVQGCSATHGCGSEGGICQIDAGQCIECTSNTDCTDTTRPICDPASSHCYPCTVANDVCPAGSACKLNPDQSYACVAVQCKSDVDCAGIDAGVGGALDDGGVAVSHCDPVLHTCQQCVTDDQCAAGSLCKGDVCVDGCTTQHGCAGGQTCCNAFCVDENQDNQNCGACNTMCNGGWNCCNATCRNPSNDTDNCGGCGIACTVMNGTAKCATRACSIATCNQGFADCNNQYNDGCETHTDSNPNNCGACGNVCSLPHSTTSCAAGLCQVDTCLPNYADCDTVTANGCETLIGGNDPTNCGACGTVCSLPHAIPQCAAGTCVVASCSPGFADCNQIAKDGCEIDLDSSTTSCGACNNACVTAHGTPECLGGRCNVMACDAGFADCDNDPRNGCEVDLGSDPSHCGTCQKVCATTNGTASCANMQCGIACNVGFDNCDQDVTNGCETSLNTNVANCGGCGLGCSMDHGTPACAQGTCKVIGCDPGYSDCNQNPQDGCEENVANDPLSCGVCGKICSSANGTPGCANSMCTITCTHGFDNCNGDITDGCETNLNTSNSNCGGCNTTCNLPGATSQCAQGACAVTGCNAGTLDCDGVAANGCEVHSNSDAFNCGSCGTVCSTVNGNATCAAGVCQISCNQGYANCDGDVTNGCEVNLFSDQKNCAACNAACNLANASATCSLGSCKVSSCNAGFDDCDGNPNNGCEINTASDPQHCGACSKACAMTHGSAACSGGVCGIACGTGFADCDSDDTNGCEVNTNTDIGNCGACNNACATANGTPACVGGACKTNQCNLGYFDCDGDPTNGCEVNIGSDPNHCGSCTKTCATTNGLASCVNFVCGIACNAGYGNCDSDVTNGCETSLTTTVNSCGACGTVCVEANAVAACVAGACAVASCNAGYSDCNGDPKDGCEIHIGADVNNCGACAAVCSSVNGTPGCTSAGCSIACSQGFDDCNKNVVDGCEINLSNDIKNCSTCGNVCAPAHGTPTCTLGVCRVATCDVGYADCNGNPADGCEVDLTTDAAHCGACANVCSNVNGTPSCFNSTCQIACNAGEGNCDGNTTNGCEVNLNNDPNNCSACTTQCSSNHVQAAVCATGACTSACAAGYADCNMNKQMDGCEISVLTDAANCGVCGTVCSSTNIAAPTCGNGVCNGLCNTGFADCDADKTKNGCEQDVFGSVANCGACGQHCSTNNVTALCTNGACVGGCNAGYTDCDANKLTNGCETNTSAAVGDPINCGGCGTVCSNLHIPSPTCSLGLCNGACATGFDDCDGSKLANGCETNLLSDVTNCGTCGTLCSANNITQACGNGKCVGSCAAGYADCDANKQSNGCEVQIIGTDPMNCGACGTVCSGNNISVQCVAGACTGSCAAGFADCNGNKQSDGCEIHDSVDVLNCGACGTICSTNNIARACAAGSCNAGTCAAGFSDCNADKKTDGCEINTAGDFKNCGTCGTLCSANNISQVCGSGSCVGTCTSGFADCDGDKQKNGCEITINSDVNNCGGCGLACSTFGVMSTVCSAGKCTGTCDGGFADCDSNELINGCESNTDNSDGQVNTVANPSKITHCGHCGGTCPLTAGAASVACVAGACKIQSCTTGVADCNGTYADGCEINTTNDVGNCNGCGVPCSTEASSTRSCIASVCTLACNTGSANCNGTYTDGCEINTTNDIANCGGCAMPCTAVANSTRACVTSACKLTCTTGFSDCNGTYADGCEKNLNTSDAQVNTTASPSNINHCGTCTGTCPLSGSITADACTAGACAITTCATGTADCDAAYATGCEVNTTTDVNHCGTCANACATEANSAPSCVGSACKLVCNTGYTDCNGTYADGCEKDLTNSDGQVNTTASPSNINHCGTCTGTCALTSQAAGDACVMGACKITLCATGWADCNGVFSDGCESNTTGNSISNCGGCGTVCGPVANATPTCASGFCVPQCNAGYFDCDGVYANGCEKHLPDSDGQANTTASPSTIDHCGSCGGTCPLTSNVTKDVCAASACVVNTCAAGFSDCNGTYADGCEKNLTNSDGQVNTTAAPTTITHCGTCTGTCPLGAQAASEACVGSACKVSTCNAGFLDCDAAPANGCEKNVSTSDGQVNTTAAPNGIDHCGTCTGTCALPAQSTADKCTAGACAVTTCTAGFADCNTTFADGCEKNVSTSDGQTNTLAQPTNINHCGTCTGTCTLTSQASADSCIGGACAIVSCNAGYSDCNSTFADGCEKNLNTSDGQVNTTAAPTTINHCGTCTGTCPLSAQAASDSCVGGACVVGSCSAGYSDCNNTFSDGCEKNLATSDGQSNSTAAPNTINHCGTCTGTCPLTANATNDVCSGSACAISVCATGYSDCNLSYADGCEKLLTTSDGQVNTTAAPNTITHCGTCTGTCALTAQATSDVCASGACVVTGCSAGYVDCNGTFADGCEKNTATSDGQTNTTAAPNTINHCGSCTGTCALPSQAAADACVTSACKVTTCNSGFADCNGTFADGCEKNTSTSDGQVNGAIDHCGSCSGACPLTANATGTNCTAGACKITACATGYTDCDGTYSNGCEKNTNTSDAQSNTTAAPNTINHCGSCSGTCALPTQASADVCSGGLCAVSACNAGYKDCNGTFSDGCESNVTNSDAQVNAAINHCGACGTACPFTTGVTGDSCVSSACHITSCSGTLADCNGNYGDGCEVNKASDTNNCNGCGNICLNTCVGNVQTASCVTSACQVTTCKTGFYDVDGACANGCESACPATGNANTTCAAAQVIGTLSIGSNISVSSSLVPLGREAWYTVTFTGNGDTSLAYHPSIALTGGAAGEFVFDVASDCSGTSLTANGIGGGGCGEGGVTTSRTTWEVYYNPDTGTNDDPSTPSGTWSAMSQVGITGKVYIRVYRKTGTVSCSSFTLTVKN